jgi:uncharacterized protein (TIGR02246 family)
VPHWRSSPVRSAPEGNALVLAFQSGQEAVRLAALVPGVGSRHAETFVAGYTDDASVIRPGVYEKDREEIRTNIAAAFAGPLNGSRVAARPVDVRFLTGDTAIVVSEDGIILPGQDAVASERLVRATWVLVRRDGGWRIASYHNSPAS